MLELSCRVKDGRRTAKTQSVPPAGGSSASTSITLGPGRNIAIGSGISPLSITPLDRLSISMAPAGLPFTRTFSTAPGPRLPSKAASMWNRMARSPTGAKPVGRVRPKRPA